MDKATDTRLCEIRSYVDGTRIQSKDQSFLLTSKDLLAFSYGRAKGYRAATGEVVA